MSTTSLEDIKNLASEAGMETTAGDPIVEDAPLPEPKIDELGRAYATGKRKTAVARGLDQAGRWSHHGQQERPFRLFRPCGLADDHQAAIGCCRADGSV